MQTESVPTTERTQSPNATLEAVATDGDDPLAEIDQLMQSKLGEEKEEAERSARLRAHRTEFADEFTRVCDEQVRPAMEAMDDFAATAEEA